MNQTFTVAVAALVLAVGVSGAVAAGPSDDAEAAYQRNDYATAVRIWLSLADRGVRHG
jgi:hypothetical protein